MTGLVNNAGLTAHLGDLADTPVQVVRRVVDVNLVGALLCARAAVQAMSTARGGRGGRSSTSPRLQPRWARRTTTSTTPPPRPGWRR